YVLKTTLQELQQKYGAVPEGTFTIEENYNVAPSLHMPVIVQKGDQRKIDKYRWGLIPFWAKEINSGYSMINARAESLEQKKSYARPFKSKRCVVPVFGFYEWKKSNGEKIPHYITQNSSDLMNVAGLYEEWKPKKQGESPINSFTIITTDANDPVSELHDRMPAMLLDEELDIWLDPNNQDTTSLKDLLRPWPNDDISFYRVGQEVNNARNSGKQLIEPYRDLFS
ncbi:MAG: hypothetical protein GVY02_02020, partial [Bacteroidetes bacterium]|nr:hypothetical protein [Bacteroidota bacterium]